MSGTSLVVNDSLTVKAHGGECKIELCFGDITQLKKKDKVDVIFVSSFENNYQKMPGTVIGALYENLGLDVDKLADDKEEDLRSLYSCWWSKPLPAKYPYRRLLCFESRRNRAGRPQELVGHAFRCLVPILKNKEASVITPILSTGNQGFLASTMLSTMVHTAVSWVKAGLPIRLLKIVIYSAIQDGKPVFLRGVDDSILKVFDDLKTRYESANLIPQEVHLEYDVYLSYSDKDQEVVKRIRACLLEAKPDIRIYTPDPKTAPDNSLQEDQEPDTMSQTNDVMTKSARVIAVLSSSYLASEDCMEQYNIALCCNRQAHRNILAPFFIETVSLPTYMGLVQYADCREDMDASISRACGQLVKALTTTDKVVKVATTDPNHYDVFVSYCHADTTMATPIVDKMKKLNPNLKVFYDVQELKTGHEWQRTLYHAIDGSSCMVALISPSYLKSAVCQEEYSLAQTKHLSQDKLHLIPVCISDGVESDFAELSHIPMLDARPDVSRQAISSICSAIASWLDVGSFAHLDELLQKNPNNTVDAPELMRSLRIARFHSEYKGNLQNSFFPKTLDKLNDDRSEKETGGVGEKEGEKGKTDEGKEGEVTKQEGGDGGIEEVGEYKLDKDAVDDGKEDKSKDDENQGGEKGKEESGIETQEVNNDTMGASKPPSHIQLSASSEKDGERGQKKSSTVVLSYHQTDAKFAYFLHDLINRFAPNVAVKSEFSSDQERLDSLEAADHIVAFLSSSYIESPRHIEEFHIGLWRQRVSPARAPLLLPVEVAPLPRKPTYFQLMGCPVNTWDVLWADLQGVQKVAPAQEVEEVRHQVGFKKLPKLSPDETLPMTEVAQMLMSYIKTSRTLVKEDPPVVRPALVNTVQLFRELERLNGQEPTSLDKYLVPVPMAPDSKQANKSCIIS